MFKLSIVLLALLFSSFPSITFAQNSHKKEMELVHRRVIFGHAGQLPLTVTRNQEWVELSRTYGPFAYGAPAPAPGTTRKWRLYAVYWDENAGGKTNIEIKFALEKSRATPTFTLPTIAGGHGNWTADGYSNWFQFRGKRGKINKNHAICYARLNSTAPYNNSGKLFWVELLAYDVFSSSTTIEIEPIKIEPIKIEPIEIKPLLLQKKHSLIGKVHYKTWSKSMESYLAGGSEYFVLEELPLYNNSKNPIRGTIYLRPTKRCGFETLKSYAGKIVKVTGIHDIPPKTSRNPIRGQHPVTRGPDGKPQTPVAAGSGEGLKVHVIQPFQVTSPISRYYTLRGKVVYKHWTKSMESYLAGGSDYFILDTTGVFNQDNPIKGTIYLRASPQMTYTKLRQYNGKMVEITGTHDIPIITTTPLPNSQHPVEIGPDGTHRQIPSAGSGEGISVTEIRVVQ